MILDKVKLKLNKRFSELDIKARNNTITEKEAFEMLGIIDYEIKQREMMIIGVNKNGMV
jgi:hypothetical protein